MTAGVLPGPAPTWYREVALGVLVLLTLVLVVGSDAVLGFTRTLVPGGYATTVRNDSLTGGNSSVQLLGNGYEWKCTLRQGYEYHFCAFELLIDPKRQKGVDMSKIKTIRMWLDYQGTSPSVRLFLRNYDPRYSRPDDAITTKFNQVEFSRSKLKGMVEIPMEDFYVANWWMVQYRIPAELAHPQFDNVVVFEIQTGTGQAAGDHHFRLQRLELEGSYLTREQLYLGILLGWLTLIATFITARLVRLKHEVQLRRVREAELLKINAVLDARGRMMEEQATTDSLTGVSNRRGLQQALLQGLAEARTGGKPLALVMFDIDHFKRVNDTHGHAVGDRILSQLAWLVQENVRDSDLFARWGGEEFVVLCRGTALAQASALAEKLRRLIADHAFEGGLRVTSSFGVAALGDGGSPAALFNAADGALYEAKQKGRNLVCAAPAEAFVGSDGT